VVLNNIMRIISKIITIITFIICFSCEDQGLIVKCPDCTKEEPEDVVLEVKLDESPSGNITFVTVYEGNIEDNVIYTTVRTTSPEITINVTPNKKYTLTALYNKITNDYIAVDSATPRVRYEKSQCDNPCYFVYDKVLDLRLKYTK